MCSTSNKEWGGVSNSNDDFLPHKIYIDFEHYKQTNKEVTWNDHWMRVYIKVCCSPGCFATKIAIMSLTYSVENFDYGSALLNYKHLIIGTLNVSLFTNSNLYHSTYLNFGINKNTCIIKLDKLSSLFLNGKIVILNPF